MENENDKGGFGTLPDFEETQDDTGNDTTNWKEIALAQSEAAKKFYGVAKRNFKDLERLKQTPKVIEKPDPEKPVTKEGFDYGELAYLTSKNVPEEDHDWLLEGLGTTGKELKDLLKSEWVQKELKERQTARMADSAVPTGTKRSQGGTFTEDTVEYWVAADKQPPESKPLAFRKKVLEARQKKVTDESKFAKNSIVAPGYSL